MLESTKQVDLLDSLMDRQTHVEPFRQTFEEFCQLETKLCRLVLEESAIQKLHKRTR